MTLPTWLEPENARITIPTVLVVAYAIYHWCRRRIERHQPDEYDPPVDKSDNQPATQSAQPSSAPTLPPSKPVETIDIPEPSPAELEEAERLWTKSLDMHHSEAPDISTDWQYMNFLYKAAMLGHVKAMSLLGDYANLRGDLVEAFYWKQRVELTGGICRNPSLVDIINAWKMAGCPEERENRKMGFGEVEAIFACAVMGYKGGVNSQQSSIILNRLVADGNLDALRFRRRRMKRN